MKLTKYNHACVLVEDGEHTALLDPGDFSAGLLKPEHFDRLDTIIITHEHGDHFHLPLVQALAAKFPEVKIVTTAEVADSLKKAGITNATTESTELVDVAPLDHESMAPLSPLPMAANIRVHYKNLVTHPGDSHHLTETKDVLLLPVAGPWGSTIEAVRMAMTLKPKIIMPIHDGMWIEDWRTAMYVRMKQYFGEQGIRFLMPATGETIEL